MKELGTTASLPFSKDPSPIGMSTESIVSKIQTKNQIRNNVSFKTLRNLRFNCCWRPFCAKPWGGACVSIGDTQDVAGTP